ncbi:MAG TPA: hypothetical protein VFZ40_07295 [Pyrinomonadaceae bacterium]
MQSPSTRARSFLSWIKNWESLSELVTWVLGIIGGFWLSPPIGTGESQAFVNATRFIVTVLIAVSIYFAVKFQKHHHARGWLIAAILGFSIFVGAWFLYDRSRTKWICNVNGQLVVMGDGDTFTERGKDNSEKPECKRCEDLIFECGNGSNPERKAESIWEKEGIENNRRKLIALYFATIPFLVLCIISTLQILHCLKQPDVRLNFHALWEGLPSDGGKVRLDLHLPVNRKRISGRWERIFSDQELFKYSHSPQPIQNSRFWGETLYFRVLDRSDKTKYRMSMSSSRRKAILDRQSHTGKYEFFCGLNKIKRETAPNA